MRSGVRIFLSVVILGMTLPAYAQLSKEARISILSGMIATEGAARIPMPLGKTGVEVSENGLIARDKLQKEIADNGAAIAAGGIVSITSIEFNDKSLEFEINGGGSKKGGFLNNIQFGVGGASTTQDPASRQTSPAPKGSKVTLIFSQKAPKELTVEELKTLLSPVLDFSKQSLARTGIEALPPEFQEAVRNREARIGMDSNTVLLALGQPHERHREKSKQGVDQEDWIYKARAGRRITFVTFEKDVVVEIRQYQ